MEVPDAKVSNNSHQKCEVQQGQPKTNIPDDAGKGGEAKVGSNSFCFYASVPYDNF